MEGRLALVSTGLIHNHRIAISLLDGTSDPSRKLIFIQQRKLSPRVGRQD